MSGQASFKARAMARETLIGCQVGGNVPWLIDLIALAGFDFAALDLEHEPITDASAAEFVRACDSAGIPSVVRVPLGERIEPLLNSGASGIMVPSINTAQAARELVHVTRYHPLGRRGYTSSVRSVNYGLGGDVQAAFRRANENLFVIALIEDESAIAELDDILAVPGIDAVRVGPGDLAQSMGFPGAERVAAVAEEIVKRVVSAGLVAGLGSFVGGDSAGAPARLAEVVHQREIGATFFQVVLNRIIGQHLVELRGTMEGVLR
jgi:4-hydroxy-2-oxoheptanedioate aldolase